MPLQADAIVSPQVARETDPANSGEMHPAWAPDAEKELSKIPFFVRGKARRNTERYAKDHGVPTITLDTLYDAKAHYGR
jgi:light-independent protochlorophyllide reductase subunit B